MLSFTLGLTGVKYLLFTGRAYTSRELVRSPA